MGKGTNECGCNDRAYNMLGEMRNSCRFFVRKSPIPTSSSKVFRGEKDLAG